MASEELKKVHEKGIAVMPMKTMRDLKDLELQTAYLKKLLDKCQDIVDKISARTSWTLFL